MLQAVPARRHAQAPSTRPSQTHTRAAASRNTSQVRTPSLPLLFPLRKLTSSRLQTGDRSRQPLHFPFAVGGRDALFPQLHPIFVFPSVPKYHIIEIPSDLFRQQRISASFRCASGRVPDTLLSPAKVSHPTGTHPARALTVFRSTRKSLSHIQALFPALPITGRPLVSPSSSYSELSQSPSDSSDASSPPSSITSTSASSIASTSACSAPSQPLPGPSPPAPPTSRRHGHPFHLSTHASTPRKPFGSFPATLPTPADPRPSSPDLTPDEYEAYAARKAPRVARRKSWWRFGLEKDDLEGGKGKGRKRDLSPDEDGEKEDGGSTKRRRSERVATWVANPEAPESPKRKRTRTRLPVVIEEEEEDDELECEDVDEGYGTEDDNGVYCVCDGPAYGTSQFSFPSVCGASALILLSSSGGVR